MNGHLLCTGIREDHKEIVASIPVILNVEIDPPSTWYLPAAFTPDDTQTDVMYELVGIGLYSKTESHFRARYLSSNKAYVYTYDGMWKEGGQNGVPRIELNASAETHFHGSNIHLPAGWCVSNALYLLRGGIQTQECFFKRRMAKISVRYSLTFTNLTLSSAIKISLDDPGLAIMHPEERYWLRRPLSYHTDEYSTKLGVLDGAQRTRAPASPSRIFPPTNMLAKIPTTSISRLRPPPEWLPLDKVECISQEEEMADRVIQKMQQEAQLAMETTEGDTKKSFMQCRCGIEGDRWMVHSESDGHTIECRACGNWSHIACQRTEAARNLVPKGNFICDCCAPPKLGPRSGPTKA